jgi:hypothetical protein
MLPFLRCLENKSRASDFEFQQRRIWDSFRGYDIHGEGLGVRREENEVIKAGSFLPCANIGCLRPQWRHSWSTYTLQCVRQAIFRHPLIYYRLCWIL